MLQLQVDRQTGLPRELYANSRHSKCVVCACGCETLLKVTADINLDLRTGCFTYDCIGNFFIYMDVAGHYSGSHVLISWGARQSTV
jgi:hypothetical protein